VDPRATRLAEVLVNYSCGVKKGENVLVEVNGFDATELVGEIIRVATRKGANAFYEIRHDSLVRVLLHHADEAQIKAQAKHPLRQMKDMQCYIGIRAASNISELGDVPAQKMKLYTTHYRKPVHLQQRVAHTRWVVLRYPNASMAQAAQMPLGPFEDFYYQVCTMDYAKMSRAMNPLVRLMNKTDQVRIQAPGTDLSLSIKGLPAIKCDGKMNIPDGEIFTSPVRASVEGTVRFNAGSLLDGIVFGAINLTFKQGKVVAIDAGAQTKAVTAILDRDPGARYVGEFALGVNPFVVKPMLDILFDEKISGSFHMALGNSYEECDNGNRSGLHWDLVQIQTPEYGGGTIHFDGKLVRKNGRFVPAALQGLNPERLK
jgi:aminopeptidase